MSPPCLYRALGLSQPLRLNTYDSIVSMLTTTRPVMLGMFGFFSLGQLTSFAISSLVPLWSVFSPIKWISSLVFVMTGQLDVVTALVDAVTFAGHGAVSAVIAATLAGLLGVMVCTTVELILRHARSSSPLGGKLFVALFAPIWLILMQYENLYRASPLFQKCVSGLERMASYDMRLSAGFGVLLLAVILPIFVLLCTKVLDLILHPEKSYS